MGEFVSLIRGINLGAHARISMGDLKAVHEALGLEAVRTHLNSGNVLFTSKPRDRSLLAGSIAKEIEKQLGIAVKVVVRSGAELRDVIARSPFEGGSARDPSRLAVMFLGSCPAERAMRDLQASFPGPEEFHASGEELFLYYPNGLGRSKLSNVYLERKLGTYGTTRNWNTVTRLLTLLAGLAGSTSGATGG